MSRIREDEEQKQRKTKESEIEQSAKLIIDQAAASELGTLRVKYNKVIEENNALSVRAQQLESERLEADAEKAKLKEAVEGQKQEISDLMAQVE